MNFQGKLSGLRVGVKELDYVTVEQRHVNIPECVGNLVPSGDAMEIAATSGAQSLEESVFIQCSDAVYRNAGRSHQCRKGFHLFDGYGD